MSLTTRMLAPIALIMSIALAFVAGSAYDNAKKIVSSNIVTIEATVVEAVSREIEFMLESTRNYMRLSAQRQIVKQYAEWLLTQKKPDRSAPEQKIFLEQINQSVAIYNYVDHVNAGLALDQLIQTAQQGAAAGQGALFKVVT